MKKLLLTTVVMMSAFMAFSQKIASGKVPQVVKDGLKKSHPNAMATWEWEDANYEANFKEGGKVVSCVLDKQGTILETETGIALAELPEAARAYLDKHYKGKKLKEVSKIVKAGGEVNYEAVMTGKEVMFDAKGNFKEVEKEKKEKD